MSYEAWGDGGDDDGRVTEERCSEIATSSFRLGTKACREMMARFVEQGGDSSTAQSIRANWNPNWGNDPGPLSSDDYDKIHEFFDPWAWA